MRGLPGILRFIGEPGEGYRLEGNDERFAMKLLQCGGVLGKMAVYEEGGKLCLVSSEIRELEASILKVDRRKHRMQIQMFFAKNPVTFWAEYVIREKCSRRIRPVI